MKINLDQPVARLTAGADREKNLSRSLLSRFVRITSQAYYSPVRL